MDDYDDGEEALRAASSGRSGALTALRDAAYAGEPAASSLNMLRDGDIIDPSAKWDAYAAGALRPSFGGAGAHMSNALSALASGKMKEAELRSKYIPLVAQAIMQRQLQQAQLAMNAWKLNQDFDQAATGALASLLSLPREINGADVISVLTGLRDRGMITPEKAIETYRGLGDAVRDPTQLRERIQQMAISRTEPGKALEAITPKIEMQDMGGSRVPANVNPMSGLTPVGPVPAQPNPALGGARGAPMPPNATPGPVAGAPLGMAKTLTPGERLPHVGADAAGNATLTSPADGTTRYPIPVEAPSAQPGAPTIPPRTTVTTKANDEAAGKDMAQYAEDLGGKITAMGDVQTRFGEMRMLMKDFRPGASGEMRTKLGGWLNDLAQSFGLSPEQAKRVSSVLNSGDFSSAQAFQKLAVQGAMEALRAAMEKGQITQGEFGVFRQNTPSVTMDPRAMDKMMNFVARQQAYYTTELEEYTKFRQSGGDLQSWKSTWSKKAKDLGYTVPTLRSGSGMGNPEQPSSSRLSRDKSGRAIYQLSDGSWSYDPPGSN